MDSPTTFYFILGTEDQGEDGPTEEPPNYSPIPSSRIPSSPNTGHPSPAHIRRGSGVRRSEHRYALRDKNGRDWLSFIFKSRAADSKHLPLFLEGDTIKGEVCLDLAKAETLKGLTITIRAGTTAVGQDEELFLDQTEPVWTPASPRGAKLVGTHTHAFTIAIPRDAWVAPVPKAARKRFPLPPTFSERAHPIYIDYQLCVTVRRGALRVNNKLSTSFTFLPRTVAEPPSPMRALVYSEGGVILGPDADPQGWKVFDPVEITGTLFNTRNVTVHCTLAMATPFTYASNSPVHLLLTLRGSDVQALDLLVSAPRLHLLRTLVIGSEAVEEAGLRRSNNTFESSVAMAVFWPHEAGAEVGPGNDPTVVGVAGDPGVRELRGELFIPKDTKQSFAIPRFACRYTIALLPPQVPGFTSTTTAPEEPLLTERITVTMANAPGITPVSHMPPGYAAQTEGNHIIAAGLLETGLSIFHSYPSASQLGPYTQAEELTDVLSAEAQDTAIAKYGIAGRVWEAAYAMMLYVRDPDAYEFDPQFEFGSEGVVVELGAGTGAAGLALAAAHPHARVLLTDLPEVCPLLQVNARGHSGVGVLPLSWGCAAHAQALQAELGHVPISCIICSDLVYFPELLAPLLRTLLHLTNTAPPPRIVISYKIRSLTKEMAFWSAFGLWFTFAPILVRARAGGSSGRWERFGAGGDGEVFVFTARRRPESLSWSAPEDDTALLEGVGAWGTQERKSDDAFELFLLMGVDE